VSILWCLIPSILPIIRDILVSIAAVLTPLVAWRGLSTWRRQLKGNADWEVSRRLLRETYKVRDAIHWLRVPARFKGEESPDEHLDIMLRSADPALQKRWIKLSKAFSDLRVEQIEAEVLWGSNTQDAFDPLRKIVMQIGSSVGLYLELSDLSKSLGKGNISELEPELAQELYGVLANLSTDDKPDAIEKELHSAVEKIEGLVRPHLGKRT